MIYEFNQNKLIILEFQINTMFFLKQINSDVLDNLISPNKQYVNQYFTSIYFQGMFSPTKKVILNRLSHRKYGQFDKKLIVQFFIFLIVVILNYVFKLPLMNSIKRKNSEITDPSPHIEWLEEYIDLDTIEITVLKQIHNLKDNTSFDCVVYIANLINYTTEFKIVYFQYLESQALKQVGLNSFHMTPFKQTPLINHPRQYINEWLKEKESSPFLIKFQISQNLNHQIQTMLAQAVQIADFIKSKILQKNNECLYDETINFINTLHKINVE